MGLQRKQGLIGAVAASLALVTLPAASAQAPVVPPSADRVQTQGQTQGQAALPRIRGTVGPGMTITVSRHRTVKGRYRIVVQDESAAHNWHISGPGVNKETSVSGTGRTVWRVRLRVGTYAIRCDVHASTMRTTLRVTARAQGRAAAPSTERAEVHSRHATVPAVEHASSSEIRHHSGAAPSKALPRLRGTVGPGWTITISRKRVTAGRYRLVITDSSSAHNWHIRGTGVNERTSLSGTGKWVWRVRLRAGTYSVLCDPHPSTMKTTLRVTAG